VNQPSLMQKALGKDWHALPAPLRRHYQHAGHTTIGTLDIAYPGWMQPLLTALRQIGALVHRRGEDVPTRLAKHMDSDGLTQRWHRDIRFADGQTIVFKSHWRHAGGNRLVEYVTPFLGLCMAVSLEDGCLRYRGCHFELKLGALRLPLPEWLLLGHTEIVEKALDEERFVMDFRIRHPLFGETYRYSGEFRA
jgi:hypothetical protein